jgi:hypothetical protein
MLDVEAALARAQATLGIIPADAASSITKAARADSLDRAALASATRNTGYPVVGLVNQLSKLAGEDAGRWTHWGATTQDIMDSALVLQIRDGLALIEADLRATIAGFATLAAQHRATVMAGRTHLQHALPVTFGYKVAVWVNPLITALERLRELRPRVLRLGFGGASGTLASLGDQGLQCGTRQLGRSSGAGLQALHPVAHILVGDGLRIDDGHNEIQCLGARRRRLARLGLQTGRGQADQAGRRQGEKAPGEQISHSWNSGSVDSPDHAGTDSGRCCF